jgi:hypothetical protein
MNTVSHREDIPNNYHLKSFLSTCLCIEKNVNLRGKKEHEVKPEHTVQSNITSGNSLSRWTSHGSNSQRTMNISGFDLEKHRLKWRGIRSKTGNSWLSLHEFIGICLDRGILKGRIFNAEYYRDHILTALTQFHPGDDGRKLVVHADNARVHTAQKHRTFVKKMDCGSLSIHPTHLISHHPTSFCSIMSRNISKEWCFYHTKNCSTLDAIGEVVKWLTTVVDYRG